jgi:hypothetical protein
MRPGSARHPKEMFRRRRKHSIRIQFRNKQFMTPGREEDIQIEKSILVADSVLRCCGRLLNFCAPANPPIELLAHRLEDAWADHHTIVETT